jgi:nucleoside-diphosphate-sugar epimerase
LRGHAPRAFDTASGFDIRDRSAVDAAVAEVDAIINLAGVLGTEETLGAEAESVDVNVVGAVHVFEAAARRDVRVVQIGTGHRGQLNTYAITKACAEDLAIARSEWLGQRIVVVRAYHAYGPGQAVSPPHGSAKVRKIIPSFICRALTGMPLEVYGSGDQTIDLVHVNDVAQCLVSALEGPWGQVVEAGTGKGTRVRDAARAVIHACQSPSKIVNRPMRLGEPDGATVVAKNPMCVNPWPWRLDETIAEYRQLLGVQSAGKQRYLTHSRR